MFVAHRPWRTSTADALTLSADALTFASDALTNHIGRFDPDTLAIGRFDQPPPPACSGQRAGHSGQLRYTLGNTGQTKCHLQEPAIFQVNISQSTVINNYSLLLNLAAFLLCCENAEMCRAYLTAKDRHLPRGTKTWLKSKFCIWKTFRQAHLLKIGLVWPSKQMFYQYSRGRGRLPPSFSGRFFR